MAVPKPRKPRRRRISRRRFYRRVAGTIVVAAILVVGTGPTLRFLGYLPSGKTHVTTQWKFLSLAPNRRSVVIRVDECDGDYDGARVMRVGDNVRLAVSVDDDADDTLACAPFAQWPTHVVRFGFTLPADGHVIESGCRKTECAQADAS